MSVFSGVKVREYAIIYLSLLDIENLNLIFNLFDLISLSRKYSIDFVIYLLVFMEFD